MKYLSSLRTKIYELCIVAKILKDFIFSTKWRPSLMGCLFSHSVQRITSPYNIFHKWYKDTRKKNSGSSGGWCSLGPNIRVRVVFSFGPPVKKDNPSPHAGNKHRKPCKGPGALPVRISVDLTLSNGMHILQKDLDYPGLHRLIQRLEVLC